MVQIEKIHVKCKIPYNHQENNFRYLWLVPLQFYVIDLQFLSLGMKRDFLKYHCQAWQESLKDYIQFLLDEENQQSDRFHFSGNFTVNNSQNEIQRFKVISQVSRAQDQKCVLNFHYHYHHVSQSTPPPPANSPAYVQELN